MDPAAQVSLCVALSLISATAFAGAPARSFRDSGPGQGRAFAENGEGNRRHIRFSSVRAVCDGEPPCDVDAEVVVPARTVAVYLIMNIVEVESELPVAAIEGQWIRFESPTLSDATLRIRGRAGRSVDARVDARRPTDLRHLIIADRGISHELNLGPVGSFDVQGLGERRRGEDELLDVRRRTPGHPLLSGGLVLSLGSMCALANDSCGFAAHLGWELAPLPWLFVGSYASIEAGRVGGFLMTEALIPTSFPASLGVGVGGGVDAEMGRGDLLGSIRVKVTVQFPILAIVFNSAFSRGLSRFGGAFQFGL